MTAKERSVELCRRWAAAEAARLRQPQDHTLAVAAEVARTVYREHSERAFADSCREREG